MKHRTVALKLRLYECVVGVEANRVALLLASLIAILYDAAPEHTKDLIDAKVADFRERGGAIDG